MAASKLGGLLDKLPLGAIGSGVSAIFSFLGAGEKERELRDARKKTDGDLAGLTGRQQRRADTSLQRADQERYARENFEAKAGALDRGRTAAATARTQALGNRNVSTAGRLGLAARAGLEQARQAGNVEAGFLQARAGQRQLANRMESEGLALNERPADTRFQYSSSRENQLAGEVNQRREAGTGSLQSGLQGLTDERSYRIARKSLPGNEADGLAEGGMVASPNTVLEPQEIVLTQEQLQMLYSAKTAEDVGRMIMELIDQARQAPVDGPGQGGVVPGEGMGDKVPMELSEGEVVLSNDDIQYIEEAEDDAMRGERTAEVISNYERKGQMEQERNAQTGGAADIVAEIVSGLTELGMPVDEATVKEIEALEPEMQQQVLDQVRLKLGGGDPSAEQPEEGEVEEVEAEVDQAPPVTASRALGISAGPMKRRTGGYVDLKKKSDPNKPKGRGLGVVLSKKKK